MTESRYKKTYAYKKLKENKGDITKTQDYFLRNIIGCAMLVVEYSNTMQDAIDIDNKNEFIIEETSLYYLQKKAMVERISDIHYNLLDLKLLFKLENRGMDFYDYIVEYMGKNTFDIYEDADVSSYMINDQSLEIIIGLIVFISSQSINDEPYVEGDEEYSNKYDIILGACEILGYNGNISELLVL